MPQKSKQYPLLEKFAWYLTERWSIRQKRLKGLPPPWTDDYALQTYRFCEVRREDDRVTQWIHENWLRPHAADRDLWHAMCVARMFNVIPTMEECGWPEPWGRRGKKFLKMAEARKARGETTFTAAYTLVGAGYVQGGGKQQTLIEHHRDILDAAWADRTRITLKPGERLEFVHARLTSLTGFGQFMAAQVIADIKHGDQLCDAPDWETFAVVGPGSIRGLNRVVGRDLNKRWNAAEWHKTLLDVRKLVRPLLPKALRNLDAQNIEHGLCELDKWCRVQEGGRPKQLLKVSTEEYK